MSKDTSQHILIVEDLKSDSRLIKRSMHKAKIANPLVFLTDGDQAIEYLSKSGEFENHASRENPVLILLDLKLPKRDGFEVLEWLKSQEGLKRIPVVVLTSSSRSPDVSRAYDLGANSYLVKPVADGSLVEMFSTLDVYWLLLNEAPDVPEQ